MKSFSQIRKSYRILIIALALITLVILLTPSFIVRALIHQQPNIDDFSIFHNSIVEAGNPQPWHLDEKYNTTQLPEEFKKPLIEYQSVAFLVIQDQKIKYEEYWDGYGPDSYSNSFSAAKSIVGLLVGAAIEEGKIRSVDQTAGDFLPAFKEGKKSEITIRDLLTMSAGLDFDEAYSSLFSPTTEMYYGSNLTGMVNAVEVVSSPGKVNIYQSIVTEILAIILEKATGMTISEYASLKFWTPMGAEYDALWSLDREDGMEKAYCCFNSNARDFARWGQLILNKGKWDDNQLLSENFIKEATSPASYLMDENGKPLTYYGYQWWIINHKGKTIPYMRGILGQYIFAIPEMNAVVVRLGKERSTEYINDYTKDIVDYLDAAFYILEQ